jgi:hypothetical protein
MSDRQLVEADFRSRRALMLPDAARYDILMKMPKDGKVGSALTAAMEAIENAFSQLTGLSSIAPLLRRHFFGKDEFCSKNRERLASPTIYGYNVRRTGSPG